MATLQNQCYLTRGGSNFACCFLPPEMCLPPTEREAYLEYGDGHLPTVARVWMTSDQFKAAVPTPTNSALLVFSLTMAGMANDYPAGTSQSVGPKTITTGSIFSVIKKEIVRIGINVTLTRVTLASQQYGWAWMAQPNFVSGAGPAPAQFYNRLSRDHQYYTDCVSSFGPPAVPYTYPNIMDAIAGALNISTGAWPFMPVAVPNNFETVGVPYRDVIGRLLDPLATRLAFNPFTNAYSIIQTDYSDPASETAALQKLGNCAAYEGSGGIALDEGINTAPSLVSVGHPNYGMNEKDYTPDIFDAVGGSPYGSTPAALFTLPTISGSDPMSGSPYSYDGYPNPTGASANNSWIDTIYLTDHFGIDGINFTENLSGITAERANCYFKRANVIPRVWCFTGGYPVVTGNTIRKVRIAMDCNSDIAPGGWYTTVWQHGRTLADSIMPEPLATSVKSYINRFVSPTSAIASDGGGMSAPMTTEMTALVQISSTNGCGKGKYLGSALYGQQFLNIADDLMFTMNGGGSTNCLIVNLPENVFGGAPADAGTGRALNPTDGIIDQNRMYFGRYLGVSGDTNVTNSRFGASVNTVGLPVYAIDSQNGTGGASVNFDANSPTEVDFCDSQTVTVVNLCGGTGTNVSGQVTLVFQNGRLRTAM